MHTSVEFFLCSPGYLPFLSLITPILYQWQQSLMDHMKKTQGDTQQQGVGGSGSGGGGGNGDPLDSLTCHELTGGGGSTEGAEPALLSSESTSKQSPNTVKQSNSKTDTPSQDTAQQQKQEETGGCIIN